MTFARGRGTGNIPAGKRVAARNQQSKEQKKIMQQRQEIRAELALERGLLCQGCSVTPVGTNPARTFTDMHEVLTRGRGGSPVDPDNILLLCRQCHQWVTEHEHAARELGLVRGRTAEEHRKTFRPWET